MEFAQMRDFSEFCEQLNEIRSRFHRWDSCERTIALYYLMVGLPFANARFLQHALEQCILAANSPSAQTLDNNANDPKFILNLLNERPQVSLSILLAHLPLLKPGNKDARDSYIRTIRHVLSEFITTPPFKIYNECVEIMSYVFVHPAFGRDEKKLFKQLLKQVVNRVSPDNFIHSPVTESSDESSVSPNPEPVPFLSNNSSIHSDRLTRRSNSLTPSHTSDVFTTSSDTYSSQENLSNQTSSKPRSYSLSSDKTLKVVLPTLQASSSETRLEELQTTNNLPVMKNIVSWLKSLRLHKYSWVFNNLTYEQMLALTEESLLAIGITKGARHKLLISINKLKERSTVLTELETEVMNGSDLLNALKKLKGILQSPLQVINNEDLPSQFVKVMGKVCTQLLMLRQPPEECLTLFTSLCDRSDNSDAFSQEQKRRLNLWRGQLHKESSMDKSSVFQQNRENMTDRLFNRIHSSHHPLPNTTIISTTNPTLLQSSTRAHHHVTNKSSSYPNMQSANSIGGHRHSLGSITITPGSHFALQQSHNTQLQDSTQNVSCHMLFEPERMSRTNIRNNPSQQPLQQQQLHVRFKEIPENISSHTNKTTTKNVDIESSLESLCLQMMEHALGP